MAKEKIPVTLLTSYISTAWDQSGQLTQDIAAIKEAYTNTKVVEECLQDIIDAYLMAAGRLQLILDNKNYMDVPDAEESEKENKPKAKKNLKEDIVITISDTDANDKMDVITQPVKTLEEPIELDSNGLIVGEPKILPQEKDDEKVDLDTVIPDSEKFEYFTDFPEIDYSKEKDLNDEDVYR